MTYDEMLKRQNEQYQQARNPFEYGQQVARRRYSEIMAGLDAQRFQSQQSYGDLYRQARQRAVGARAAGGPTLSGGMGQQRRDFVSALEMQELGKIGAAQEQANRDLYAQGQAAFSNAQLEGQQATQMELQNQQAALALVQQKQKIANDSSLSAEQKREQLAALGADPESVAIKNTTVSQVLTGSAIGVGVVGGIGKTVMTGLAVKGTLAAAATTAGITAAGTSAILGTTVTSAMVGGTAFGGALTSAMVGGTVKAGLAGLSMKGAMAAIGAKGLGGFLATAFMLHPVAAGVTALVIGLGVAAGVAALSGS
jgi:hypothetical protein